MADVLLFHHIQGLTPGVVAFADELRAAGHTVHVPDLFEGRTFDTIKEGAAYAQAESAPDFDALADGIAADLPTGLVYAGFSFGVPHGPTAGADPARRQRRAALRGLHPAHR